MMRSIVAAVVLALVPALAWADGFYTHDLGEGGTADACTFRAQRALNAFLMEAGQDGATMASGTWSVDGYNLQPGNVDVEFLCPYRDVQVPVALIVSHSAGSENDRVAIVTALVERWNATDQDGDVRNEGGGGAVRK